MIKRSTKKKAAKTPRRKRGAHVCDGLYSGKVKTRWQAAFDHRVSVLAKHKYITCSEAMAETKDDAGACPFSDWDIKKHQWKLQRMFTQLEADGFKEPTKGEHYVMLYEILYGTKTVVTKMGTTVDIEISPFEKVLVIKEMLKMGGHYAPTKGEISGEIKHAHSFVEQVIMTMAKVDSENNVNSGTKNRFISQN